ncbi:jerky protein homolog-like [Osmia bicornis bicornis]|uniref:jerky protein homolog-like n=1 Tax=Osmia bicornis bicornis TaxID=1437191 RepID=UPI001EAF191D|nr:jerky protein homolog-like [Osmia bicornis bicornis]
MGESDNNYQQMFRDVQLLLQQQQEQHHREMQLLQQQLQQQQQQQLQQLREELLPQQQQDPRPTEEPLPQVRPAEIGEEARPLRKDRLKVLEDLKHFSISLVAKKYNVNRSTIWRIKYNAPKVMEFVDKGKIQRKRRRVKPSLYDALEQSLLAWFIERRTVGDFISNDVIMQKARELKDSMGLPLDFKVSRGWLDGFKKRHNIALVKVYGESASADEDAAIRFCNDFIKLLEEDDSINIDNIYNMDEAGLLWKALPSKTLIERKEKVVKGYKSRKERITVALCANVSGTHKLMPLVINKFENPRALKHCKSNLPVIFKSQKNAWMTQVLFRDWYENYFKPSVRAYQLNKGVTGKVILLLDNCAGHTVPPELLDADNFKIMYLPPNTTSLIQPMDQGIIAKLKCLYRHKTLRKTITYPCGISKFQKQFTLKDCIEILHESWSEVSANNIINSWKKIIPSQEDWYQRAMREDISSFTGDTYSHRDITEFLSICEQEERRTHTDEGDEEIQENVEEEVNKQEERQRLYERLGRDLTQEAPFLQKFFKLIKDQVLGTDD